MFRYTPFPGGDEVIRQDLEKIIRAVRGMEFESLVLFGAYGKGEGCLIDGKPRNDYDLLLVGGKSRVAKKIERAKTLVKAEVWHVLPVDVREAGCSQQWFEIKYGSQLLAGKPLDLPEWQPWEIPFADAINSIDRRCVSMILGKYEMMKEKPDWRKVVEQICKGLISIGDAILIRRGEFHPLYTVRAAMLAEDEIGSLYQKAVSIKIYNRPVLNPDQTWHFWYRVRNLMREFVLANRIKLAFGEALFSIDERTEKEKLEALLKEMGAEKWL